MRSNFNVVFDLSHGEINLKILMKIIDGLFSVCRFNNLTLSTNDRTHFYFTLIFISILFDLSIFLQHHATLLLHDSFFHEYIKKFTDFEQSLKMLICTVFP